MVVHTRDYIDIFQRDIKDFELQQQKFYNRKRSFGEPQEASADLSRYNTLNKQPHGTSLVINSCRNPLLNSMLYIAPSFLSGNITLIKPSSYCYALGLELEEIFNENTVEKAVISLLLRSKEIPEFLERVDINTMVF